MCPPSVPLRPVTVLARYLAFTSSVSKRRCPSRVSLCQTVSSPPPPPPPDCLPVRPRQTLKPQPHGTCQVPRLAFGCLVVKRSGRSALPGRQPGRRVWSLRPPSLPKPGGDGSRQLARGRKYAPIARGPWSSRAAPFRLTRRYGHGRGENAFCRLGALPVAAKAVLCARDFANNSHEAEWCLGWGPGSVVGGRRRRRRRNGILRAALSLSPLSLCKRFAVGSGGDGGGGRFLTRVVRWCMPSHSLTNANTSSLCNSSISCAPPFTSPPLTRRFTRG